jgi:hypothetical protein
MNAAARRHIVVITAASFVGCLRLGTESENIRLHNKLWWGNPFRGDDFEAQKVSGSITDNLGRRVKDTAL